MAEICDNSQNENTNQHIVISLHPKSSDKKIICVHYIDTVIIVVEKSVELYKEV